MIARLSACLVLTTLLAAVPASAAGLTRNRPGPKARNQFVVFDRAPATPGAPSTVWITFGDGTEPRNISQTPAGASDSEPELSLGFGIVVWERSINGGPPQIMFGDVFGSPASEVTSAAGGATDAATARGGEIAYSARNGSACELWITEPFDTQMQRRLTEHGAQPVCDTAPAFSHDGKRIAFRRTTSDAAGNPVSSSVMVIAAAGGEPQPFGIETLLAPDPIVGFGWGPGRELLVVTGGIVPALRAVAPDGSTFRTLVVGEGVEGVPSWAPMSAYATFVQRQADGSTDIARVGPSGGAIKNLTNTPGESEGHPTWGYPSNQGSGVGSGVHAKSSPVSPHKKRKRRPSG